MTENTDREITAKINTAELVRAWEERARKARGIRLVTSIGAKTDLGRVRENNEDKFEFFVPEDEDTLALKGSFYAVADGMGGHSAGQIASELAIKTAIRSYYNDPNPVVEDSLKQALQQANALIFDAARAIAERSGMGTTMTALVLRGEEAFIAQVGDSRCYRLRDGELRQLTEDHSWVNEQVKRGGLSVDEAEASPFRNVITRSLGNSPSVEVDVFTEQVEAGDVFLLCSDGLTGEVSDEEICRVMASHSPSEAAWNLVDLALEHGGRDNVTVLIVAVREIARQSDEKQSEQELHEPLRSRTWLPSLLRRSRGRLV
ncbi:MAG: Stp1/IreP family PP2C-type Ser/Thr phosphatase [Armatimonadetes bacterium]|nr:Stp1/IreP family PP2C-type Ser/Thr phosphatase [Armatimonadota bacterium]